MRRELLSVAIEGCERACDASHRDTVVLDTPALRQRCPDGQLGKRDRHAVRSNAEDLVLYPQARVHVAHRKDRPVIVTPAEGIEG